jgi:hypothetical protein
MTKRKKRFTTGKAIWKKGMSEEAHANSRHRTREMGNLDDPDPGGSVDIHPIEPERVEQSCVTFMRFNVD